MKKLYFIHITNVLKGVDKWERRTTKQGVENCANKALATYGSGTVAVIEDEQGFEIAIYTR